MRYGVQPFTIGVLLALAVGLIALVFLVVGKLDPIPAGLIIGLAVAIILR
jgi:hypothetical protein